MPVVDECEFFAGGHLIGAGKAEAHAGSDLGFEIALPEEGRLMSGRLLLCHAV